MGVGSAALALEGVKDDKQHLMRVLSVTTVNIGGLPGGTTPLPEGAVAAFAGGNGTGKSKLLGCILAPWSNIVPTLAQGEATARVDVRLRLTTEEREALLSFNAKMGWEHVAHIPEDVTVGVSHHPMTGTERHAEPNFSVLRNAWLQQSLLQVQPSLNVVYLPAERRLLAPGYAGIDLQQLSEAMAWQKTAEPRGAVQNYGRLDDQEFEGFAKALCVAGLLPSEFEGGEETAPPGRPRIDWIGLQKTVDALIAPKRLLPLTQQNPEQLRIQTPAGTTHPVQDLSSGERQALIIISRVLRAGAGHTLVIIDEPDAYLHPHLSQRLVKALEEGVGPDGQLVLATHSPAVLDGLPPSSILRLSHQDEPRLVASEEERLDLYRAAGFRASALTQSDLLMVVEGTSDEPLLRLLFPELARAAIRSAGGRAQVLREVAQLRPYDLPVLGVVDRDVLAPEPEAEIRTHVAVWPTGDIEGVFLSDPLALEVMLTRGLIKRSFADVAALQTLLQALVDGQRDNVIAEVAQRKLREVLNWEWPTPKGAKAIDRLRSAVGAIQPPTQDQVDAAFQEAEALWDRQTSATKWHLVRAKYILGTFVDQATEMKSGRSLLEAVAREQPALSGLHDLRTKIAAVL